MLKKSLVVEINKIQTNKTFMASKQNFNVFSVYSNIQNFFLLLHVPFAIHRNFRDWHHILYNRSGSHNIHALPIFIFLVYRFHGNIDYLTKHARSNIYLFSKNWCNIHMDQSKGRLIKRQQDWNKTG